MSSVLPHIPPCTLNSISPALQRLHSYRACTSGSRVLLESCNVWLDSSWKLRWLRALPRSLAGRASREVAKPWLLPRETFPEPQLLVPPVCSGQQPQYFHSGGEPISNGSCGWVLFFLFFFFLLTAASTPSFPHSGEAEGANPTLLFFTDTCPPWLPPPSLSG